MSEYTKAEIETMKVFDRLRAVRCYLERIHGKKEATTMLDLDGVDYEAESLALSILACDLNRFKELVDTQDSFYAEFIGGFYEVPYMAKAMKSYDEFKACA